MVAYEAIHSMKTQKTGKTGSMAIKLDMSIAYDREEWPCLEVVMFIRECITTVSYSVLVNGQLGGVIEPLRGLRQGGHLSS